MRPVTMGGLVPAKSRRIRERAFLRAYVIPHFITYSTSELSAFCIHDAIDIIS